MISNQQITTREELLFLISQAAELEHSLGCQYLYTAFSLKETTDEGVSPEQLDAITWWREAINEIAVQEMLHLALASNLLTAIGGAPYFRRANFPQAKTYTTLGLVFSLAPFSQATLNRYICFELPNNFADGTQRASWAEFCAQVKEDEDLLKAVLAQREPLVPRKPAYETIADLYGLIRQGFQAINNLFIGPPSAQAAGIFPEMIRVTDTESALQAIDLIIRQGEGCPDYREDSHFGKFVRIRQEYVDWLSQDPGFQPARPVIKNPLLDLHQDNFTPGANIISDPLSRDVEELFVALYEVMLHILLRFFAHTQEAEEKLYRLKSAFLNLMTFALAPLGRAITRLPAGPQYPAMKAGPSFEVFSDVQLLPHMTSAWVFIQERLYQIAAASDQLINDPRTDPYPLLVQTLVNLSAALRKIAHTISLHLKPETWENGVSQLFSPMDVDHMLQVTQNQLDLGQYENVKQHAVEIREVVNIGSMPPLPLGAWTSERMDAFEKWIKADFPK